jgi:hypothetical protein
MHLETLLSDVNIFTHMLDDLAVTSNRFLYYNGVSVLYDTQCVRTVSTTMLFV